MNETGTRKKEFYSFAKKIEWDKGVNVETQYSERKFENLKNKKILNVGDNYSNTVDNTVCQVLYKESIKHDLGIRESKFWKWQLGFEEWKRVREKERDYEVSAWVYEIENERGKKIFE